jgi:hypothetical protein
MTKKLYTPKKYIDPYHCENWKKHTVCPEGYLQWQAWAEEKSKKYMQIKCADCGLYAIWVKSTKPL